VGRASSSGKLLAKIVEGVRMLVSLILGIRLNLLIYQLIHFFEYGALQLPLFLWLLSLS